MNETFEYRNDAERAAIVLAQELLGLVMIHDDHTIDGSGFLGIATFGPETRTVRAKSPLETALDANRIILESRRLTLIEMSDLVKLQIGTR